MKKNQYRQIAIFFVCLAFLNSPFIANAQTKNSLSLRFGPGFYAKQDQTFSPFVHSNWSMLNLGIDYFHKGKNVQFAGVQFGQYKPILIPSYTYDGDKQTNPHVFTLVNVWYGYGKSILQKSENKSLSVGANFEADIQPSGYNFGWNGSFGYLASLSLGAWALYDYKLNEKSSFSARAILPLISLVARSPYLVNDDEFIENIYSHNGVKTFFAYLGDGNIQTWNKIQQLELMLNYKYHLSNRWDIGAAYEFRFIHSSTPTNFISYRNTFFLKGTYKF